MSEETPKFEITPEFIDNLRMLQVAAKGGDPRAQQTLTDFLKIDTIVERSNLPTTYDVIAITQLYSYGKLFFPNDPKNIFTVLADTLSLVYSARKGWKSEGIVDMMKRNPNFGDLKTVEDLQTAGFMDRLFRRGGTE